MYVQFRGTTEKTQIFAGVDEYIRGNAAARFYGEIIGPSPAPGFIHPLSNICSLSSREGYGGTRYWHEEDFVRLNPDLTLDEIMEFQYEAEEHLDEMLESVANVPVQVGILSDYERAIKALEKVAGGPKKPKIDYEKVTEGLCKVSAVPLIERDYSKPHYDPKDENRREKMQTLSILVDTGNIIEGKFRRFNRDTVQDCCHLFNKWKTSHDLVIYIPVDWCNYMGYTDGVVKLWMDFIRELRFPFGDIVYAGAKTSQQHQNVRMSSGQPFFIKTNLYHNIVIKASEVDKLNYLAFLLIRYLYHSHYNNIPGLCLQIKGQTTLSNWEILMLVHCLHQYEQDYGLFRVNITEQYVKIPFIGDKENSEKGYFKQLSLKDSVNKSFYYVSITPAYYQQLIQIITKKEYIKLKGWREGIKDNIVQPPNYDEMDDQGYKYGFDSTPRPVQPIRLSTGHARSRTGIVIPGGPTIGGSPPIETEAPRPEQIGQVERSNRTTRRETIQWTNSNPAAQSNQVHIMSAQEIAERLTNNRPLQPTNQDNQF